MLFFESLAASGSGSSRSAGSAAAGASAANPVYNLLPDCLSALLAKADPPLREEQMQVIMSQLLGYVKVSWGRLQQGACSCMFDRLHGCNSCQQFDRGQGLGTRSSCSGAGKGLLPWGGLGRLPLLAPALCPLRTVGHQWL